MIRNNPGETGVGGQVLFRNLMFAFPGRATHHGEVTLLRAGVQPPAEPTRHAFQMGVVQMVFRAKEPTPPNSKASGIVTGGKVGIHDNAIHAVVTAVQKILVSVSQRVHHGGHSSKWLKILRRVAVFARRFQAKGFRGRFGSAGSEDRATLASDLSAVASDHMTGAGLQALPLFCFVLMVRKVINAS